MSVSTILAHRHALSCSRHQSAYAHHPPKRRLSVFAQTAAVSPPRKGPKDKISAYVSQHLKNVSLIIIGNSSTELNEDVAARISKKIGYCPVLTRKVLQGIQKTDDLRPLVGSDELTRAEARVLTGMADQLRCCTATLAGSGDWGSAAQQRMLSSFVVLIEDTADEASSSQPAADIRVTLGELVQQRGFATAPEPINRPLVAARFALLQLLSMLQQDPGLPQRKLDYMAAGWQGEAPKYMPAPTAQEPTDKRARAGKQSRHGELSAGKGKPASASVSASEVERSGEGNRRPSVIRV